MTNNFLNSKVALVTGGGKGIGLAIACALKNSGAKVYICGRGEDSLRAAADKHGLSYTLCDISDSGAVRAMFERICAAEGGLDILINNAGFGVFKKLEQTSDAQWQSIIDINLSGTFYCSRSAIEPMRRRGGGRIINISSVMGLKGYVDQGAYAASKHGMMGLSKVLGLELAGDNIIVQVICPGGVDTPMVAESRPDLDRSVLMSADDVAQAVIFCLQQEGNAITDVLSLRRRSGSPFA